MTGEAGYSYRYMTQMRLRHPHCKFTLAIEGPDRVGKQTQVRLLVDRLMSLRFACEQVEVPVIDVLGAEQIYGMLDDGRALKYPSTFQGLQLVNRCLFVSERLNVILERNEVVVFDRWNASMQAYGSATGLDDVELACYDSILPDVDYTMILDGAMHAVDDQLDTFERDCEFQQRVRDAYARWTREHNNSCIIDATGSIYDVHNRIWNTLLTIAPHVFD